MAVAAMALKAWRRLVRIASTLIAASGGCRGAYETSSRWLRVAVLVASTSWREEENGVRRKSR